MRSIRWKLIAAFVLVVMLPIYFLNRHAVRHFDQYTRKALEDQMVSYAFIIGEQYRAMVLRGGDDEAFAALLRSYLPWAQVRMRILSVEGRVLHDTSERDPTIGLDISDRPEVRRALAGRYGARTKLTEDRQYMFYYVALPVRNGDELVAVSYVSRNTSPIMSAILAMAANQRAAAWIALAMSIVVASILALTITRRLRRVSRAARQVARGGSPAGLEVGGRDEIAELAATVRGMAEELERRNTYNRDFISTITHELKMPLTAIKGSAELLDQGATEQPEARRKFLSNIRYECERMVRMVWELSELTKLDVETTVARREVVDLNRLLAEILDRYRSGLDAPHPALQFKPADSAAPAEVVAGRIEQVMANLLDNAIRYTDAEGSVTLSVRCTGGRIVVTVHDSGAGIAASNLPKVFDRFFTTEPKGRPREYGSGLGLSIARSIIEKHQGRIWAESEAGQGTRVFVELPLAM